MKKGFFKWSLLSLALVLTSIGCPHPRQTSNVSGEDSLEILLPSNPIDFATERSIEDVHVNTNPHYFKDVTIYLKYADEKIHTHAWSTAEIISKKKLLHGAGTPTMMHAVVNGEQISNAQFANQTALDVARNSITVASQNLPVTILANDANGNLMGSYAKSQTAFLSGTAPFTTPHPTISNTRQAAVQLSSSVARFELGTLKSANFAQLTSITIDAVYVNNYYTTAGKTTSVKLYGSTWNANKPATGHWSKITGNNALVTSNIGTKCYAFQIFPDTTLMPHFIYEISGTLAPGVTLQDGETSSFTGKYITVTGFAQFTSSTPPAQHNVYKIGLTNGGTAINVDNITSLPDVNALEVAITILPWTEATVTPNI